MVIVSVADLSSMRIELLVDETDIGEVAVGQGVEFTVDAYPNKTFHGVVTDISKKAVFLIQLFLQLFQLCRILYGLCWNQ